MHLYLEWREGLCHSITSILIKQKILLNKTEPLNRNDLFCNKHFIKAMKAFDFQRQQSLINTDDGKINIHFIVSHRCFSRYYDDFILSLYHCKPSLYQCCQWYAMWTFHVNRLLVLIKLIIRVRKGHRQSRHYN